jgi:excisionase family DNA binding protein
MRAEQFLTVEQTAQRLRLQPSTIRRQLRVGALRGVKRGHIWRVPESALLESRPTPQPVTTSQNTESPFEKALALVAQLEKQMQGKPQRISGVSDAATELRQLREELTP